ncbi:NAD(P)H-dependent oxidoreductase [Pseudoalteromonas sp. McH1-7]|uniref:NAD(P)H-dependent oxidoreductase n=1 Tax=Pseudoalteromonas sp. McH1-7 TaxID=2745574 RepID=UPI00159192F2|nr:NAD(P)H-dependent oxidoreductase [Pseudoalteromonas sp. McH1-7]NUZ10898.1 NAD(P)H-dependent oxidoreductase [Pseudoalteromonas sp. McH1-7]
MKKILLLNGNPKNKSLCHAITTSYAKAASTQHQVRRMDLHEMHFEVNLMYGYEANQVVEPCLQQFQQNLLWAEHIVIVSPLWWLALPAKLKGLIDRTLLPGFAFKYSETGTEVEKLLPNKTARVILTSDAPQTHLEQAAEGLITQLTHGTLGFCGIAPTQYTLFGPAHLATSEVIDNWLSEVTSIAVRGE